MGRNDFAEGTGSVDEFFYFIDERHQIYLNRERGDPRPWTTDHILNNYYFTNVFRELDKTTVWIRRHLREPHWNGPNSHMIFNMAMARYFNYIPTLEELGWQDDWPWQREYNQDRLQARSEEGHKVFNDAYLIAGSDLKGKSKIAGVCSRLDIWWDNVEDMAKSLKENPSLEYACDLFQNMPGTGGFIAYEIACDLRWTRVLEQAQDINTWANAGPGAIRGLQRIYGRSAVKGPQMALDAMASLLRAARTMRGRHVPAMELREIEHSLCEYDKYCRIKYQEGVCRRYRAQASR